MSDLHDDEGDLEPDYWGDAEEAILAQFQELWAESPWGKLMTFIESVPQQIERYKNVGALTFMVARYKVCAFVRSAVGSKS